MTPTRFIAIGTKGTSTPPGITALRPPLSIGANHIRWAGRGSSPEAMEAHGFVSKNGEPFDLYPLDQAVRERRVVHVEHITWIADGKRHEGQAFFPAGWKPGNAPPQYVAVLSPTWVPGSLQSTPIRDGRNAGSVGHFEQVDSRSVAAKTQPEGVPDGITREDVIQAIKEFNAGIEHDFGDSTLHDLLVDGHRYPPKAILGLAAKRVLGHALKRTDFKSGLLSKNFRVLRQLGFEIVAKDASSHFPDEVGPATPHTEGAVHTVKVNRYERDEEARQECIEHYGAKCQVCEMEFGSRYGEDLAAGFIHVHHLRPLHTIKAEYIVDPIDDLRPVCPNCHAMLHRGKSPPSIEELRSRYRLKLVEPPQSVVAVEQASKMATRDR